jgi:hypothetical protein
MTGTEPAKEPAATMRGCPMVGLAPAGAAGLSGRTLYSWGLIAV